MEIRPAKVEDGPAVCALWKQLITRYNKKAEFKTLERSFRFAVGHPGQVRVYIAVLEGEVAGTASLHQGHYSTWNDYWYGHIEDVIVAPAYRRRGVGEALVRHVVTAAGELGLSRLELNALCDNTLARTMYEKIGFVTDSVVYELPVGTAGGHSEPGAK
jgi:ribosomal protein S18 acetylase RimI-like enzyme